jgi:hypothetical protein
VSPSYAPRGRPRLAAAAALILFHVALVIGLLSLRATRERAGEGMLTILLRTPPPPPPSVPLPAPAAARSLPVLVAPVPIVAPTPQQAAEAPVAVAIAAPASGAASAPATAASGPLNLKIPKEFFSHPPPLTPAQQAMDDPRSNHIELTKQEKIDIAFGAIECIVRERQPDGTIWRGPGHLKRMQGVSTNSFTAHKPGEEDRPMECVR